MTSCINLKRIRVSGWKAIRDPLEIEFDGKTWLIHGENEVGKSSIFSSIRFALFEEPDTSGAYARNWVNNASTEAHVEVELLIDGSPYTIHKTRGQSGKGMTRLFDGIGGERAVLVEGKDAAKEILALVGAVKRSGRSDEMPENWGILAWLLAPQGMDSVSPARENATHHLGLERAASPDMISVQKTLDDFLADELTPGGKKGDRSPKKGGALKSAIDMVAVKVREKERLEAQRVEYMESLQQLAREKAGAKANQDELDEASGACEEQQDAKIDVTKLEGQIGELEEKSRGMAAEAKAALNAVETLADIQKDVSKHEADLEEAVKDIAVTARTKNEVGSQIKELDDRKEAYSKEQREKDKSIEKKNQHIIAALHASRLDQAREKVKRLDEIDKVVSDLKKEGPVLDATGLGELKDLARKLDLADSMLRSLAETAGVSVELEGNLEARWAVDGRDVEFDGGMRFARELVIDAGDFQVTLSQVTGDDADWIRQRAEGLERLKLLGLSTTEELRTRIRSQQERGERMRELATEKAAHGNREPLDAEIKTLAEGNLPDGDGLPDILVLEAEIEALKEEREHLEGDIDETASLLEERRAHRGKLVERLTHLRAKEESSKSLKRDATTRRDREIEQTGTLKTREKALANQTAEQVVLDQNLDTRRDLKKTEEEAQKTGVTTAFRVKAQLERAQRNLDAKVISLERACKDLGGQGLQRERIELDRVLSEAETDRDRLRRRVDTAERLRHRFRNALEAATELEIGPIKDQVEVWLAQVTQGRWTRIEMDSRLEVTMLKGPDQTIPGEKVGSAGLLQLIHALIRLAVAVNIHKGKSAENADFPAVALVMDESQAHVSKKRVLRLAGILNRQVETGRVQVIALSHRRDEFQSLNAMNYDVSTREAYEP